jgi:hypothetical protein
MLSWFWTLNISNFTLGALCQQSELACKYHDFFKKGGQEPRRVKILLRHNPLVTDKKKMPPPWSPLAL